MDISQFKNDSHVYDLNIVQIYRDLQALARNSPQLLKEQTPEMVLKRWEAIFRDYCHVNNQSLDEVLSEGKLLVTDNQGFYVAALVLKLFTLDSVKIPLFLAYHKSLASNRTSFLGVIEFQVLNSFKNNSPFIDTESKLTKISDWLLKEKKRPQIEKPKETDFTSAFVKKAFANDLVRILAINDIVIDGKWEGKTRIKTEINYLIKLLMDKGHLKSGDFTFNSKVFCQEFNLDIKTRSHRHIPKLDVDVIKQYQKIIPDRDE